MEEYRYRALPPRLRKEDVVVGMTVYLRPLGNAAYRNTDGVISGTVTKMGREYMYVKLYNTSTCKVRLDTFEYYSCNDNLGYIVYKDPAEYAAERGFLDRLGRVRDYFARYNSLSASPISEDGIYQIYNILVDEGVIPVVRNEQ